MISLPDSLRPLAFRLRRPFAPEGFPDTEAEALHREVAERFASILRPWAVEKAAFERFKRECGYADSYVSYMGPELLDEKLLEHFVSLELLREGPAAWGPEDAVIDVGSAASPFADYIARRFGCRAYTLDLAYEPGVHGNRIGASAEAIPLEAGSVAAMTLHCTIDHFEGEADSGFQREAARVLRPGGRVCVLPVYFAAEPTNVCDPTRFSPKAQFDGEARVRRVRDYHNRFGRFYSPATFERRILRAAPELDFTLCEIGGERAAIPNTYLRYALVAERSSNVPTP